jgi:hypothetical protein
MNVWERYVEIANTEDLRALAIELAIISDETTMDIVVTELEKRRVQDQEETKKATKFLRK